MTVKGFLVRERSEGKDKAGLAQPDAGSRAGARDQGKGNKSH